MTKTKTAIQVVTKIILLKEKGKSNKCSLEDEEVRLAVFLVVDLLALFALCFFIDINSTTKEDRVCQDREY